MAAAARSFPVKHPSPWLRLNSVVVQGAVVVGAIVIGWQILIFIAQPSGVVFPSPAAVASALRDLATSGFNNYPLYAHVGMSVLRVALGTLLALVVGVPAGFAMAGSQLVRRAVSPYIALFRPVPPFAMLAIFAVWFGIGEVSKVLLIYAGTVSIVAVATMDAVQRIPREYREAALTLGAGRRQLFSQVVWPAALPQIFSGTRVALAVAWTSLVVAEWIGGQAGIATIILQSAEFIRTDQTFAGIILLAVVGGASDRLLVLLQRATTGWATR